MAAGYTGPHLQVAAFCERVIEDKQGVLSLIRLVDQITNTVVGPDVPDQMPAFMVTDLVMVVTLKADQARGRYALKVRPEDPSGRHMPVMQTPVHLEGGERGVNVLLPLQFHVELEGLYWFDILFSAGGGHEDRLLSRIPLRVIYRPQRLAAQ
jgi:hypothetical protein